MYVWEMLAVCRDWVEESREEKTEKQRGKERHREREEADESG